jgi:Flp pilus assembly protein TadG
VLNKLRNFARDARGNVVMTVGLAVPVIFLFVAGALDFSRVIALKGELQDAADVASVGSVAINSTAYKIGQTMGSGEITAGEVEAARIFYSDMKTHPELSAVTPKATVMKSGTLITSSVTVTGNYKPYMLGLFGFKTLPISVNSKSQASMPPYIDFYLLLDNSPSMGLGATTADITLMQNNTPASKYGKDNANCAFACHQSDKPGTDYYALAKKLGVTMRIDVVRQATQNLMTTAKKTQALDGQYRMAIYNFGLTASSIDQQNPQPYQISALTKDLTLSAQNAAAIDLMIMPSAGYNNDSQTNLTSYLTAMNTTKIIPAPGNGLTSSTPQKVLFFVSDGLNDGYNCAKVNVNACRNISPLDTTQCTAIKARGIRIAVLYTTYIPLAPKVNAFYDSYVAGYVPPKSTPSKLATQMEACASPGLYFEVSPSQGINEAMTALFNKVVSVVRINS